MTNHPNRGALPRPSIMLREIARRYPDAWRIIAGSAGIVAKTACQTGLSGATAPWPPIPINIDNGEIIPTIHEVRK